MRRIFALYLSFLLVYSCKTSFTVPSEDIAMLSGEWNSPCTAPLPDMDYMDCPMVDDIEKFVVDAQTGKGKLISGFDNLTFEVPIEIIRLQKDLGIVIHGKDQVSTGRIVKLTDKELIVNFEDEAYAKIWKRP